MRLKHTFFLAAVLLSLFWLNPALAQEPPEENQHCLTCHSNPDIEITFADGTTRSGHVSGTSYHASIHGQEAMTCGGCHPDHQEYPHPELSVAGSRDYTLQLNETCLECHPDQSERVQDSNHARAMAEGNENAAVCVDCHTAHNTTSLAEARVEIAATCRQCHADIYGEYNESVHGNALYDENNTDVPTCVDCHGVHTMDDPGTVGFRLHSPVLCADCHADEELMEKYDISTEIFQTYVSDFHGTTVQLFPLRPGAPPEQAVCYDCHGSHNIKASDDPDSAVMKENLVKTCQQCHEDANSNFPDAWMGHYEPSQEYLSSVYFTEIFFVTLTVAVLIGLEGHVLLDFFGSLRDKLMNR